jgi:hypothetical protein
MPFEVLNVTLVLFRGCTRFECAEVTSFACARIDLPGIQAVFAGRKFANHMR